MLILPALCISESCIKIKTDLIFYFHTSFCGASKGFMKVFRAFIKPFEAPHRSVKIKIWVNFFSSFELFLAMSFLAILLFTLFVTLDATVWCSFTCNSVMFEIWWSLPMVMFFWKIIAWSKLFNTGILNRWFGPGLTVTFELTVSKPLGSLISFILNGIVMLLVVLLRLTLHFTFTSFPEVTMLVLDIAVNSVSSFPADRLMRLTNVETLLRLVFTNLFVRE